MRVAFRRRIGGFEPRRIRRNYDRKQSDQTERDGAVRYEPIRISFAIGVRSAGSARSRGGIPDTPADTRTSGGANDENDHEHQAGRRRHVAVDIQALT
jgi:hypothetical protein